MKILDRYVLKEFFVPFIYCIFGFIAIWFIFDLSDNLTDFLEGKVGFAVLLEYYKSQVPEIIVVTLPIGQLLALLYALTAMSRTNELISMLGAGLSVVRILVPLFAVGFVLVGVTAYFNYESAPHAAMVKKQMLREIKRGRKLETGLAAHLYRNREDFRTWFIRKISTDREKFFDIQILQQDAEGNIMKTWYARDGSYDGIAKSWIFRRAKYVEMDTSGKILKSEFVDEIIIPGWRENPWRIASSVMNPNYLSVEELQDYLEFNWDFPTVRLAPYRTQLQYRWALPWVCLLVVFIGAPLGIVYSRRGILGGVAAAIAIFFSLVFVSSLFVALGKGDRLSPFAAAWGPMFAYLCVGILLLWYRSTNRELPKFKLPWSA
jgi:lipopolysaccharide export system permease protein